MAAASRAYRQSAGAKGKRAEDLAYESLLVAGYVVLGRNVRIGHLEVDLIAQKGDLVVIAEVRTRGGRSFESASSSVSRTKREALLRAARALWRGRFSKIRQIQRLRIDIAAVDLTDESVEWIVGAITENDR